MMNPFDRLDDALHGLADARLKRWQRLALLGAMAALLFGFLLTRSFPRLQSGDMGQLAGTAAFFTLIGVLFMQVAYSRISRAEGSMAVYLLASVGCIAMLLIRLSMLEKETGDYSLCLSSWYEEMKPLGFAQAMRADIGNYTMPYRYLIWLITRVPIPDLYMFKFITLLFEAALAREVMLLSEIRAGNNSLGRGLALYMLTLALPTVVFNGAFWGQCDAVYTLFALYGLRMALKNKPYHSAAGFGLSLAFKLQAVFLFPILPVLWGMKRLKVKHVLALCGAWLAAMVPALLCGRSFAGVLSPYFSQMNDSMELTRNAPSIFQLFDSSEMNPWMFSNWGIAMALGAAVVLCMLLWHCRDRLTPALVIDAAFLMVLVVPFLLPHMHERYFFMADMLSIAYYAGRRERAHVPLLVITASFNSYLKYLQNFHSFVSPVIGTLALLFALVSAGAELMHVLHGSPKEIK